MTPKTIIAIARELGSGGSEVGQLVASRMNYAYIDREILSQAAETLGCQEKELSRREERLSTFWEKLVTNLCLSSADAPFSPPPPLAIADDRVFAIESQIIKGIAQREDCVIVGRGAAYVLHGLPGVTSILLHAPAEFRVRRVMDIYSITDQEKALAMIRKADQERKAFVSKICGRDWMCAREYHLCINTSVVPLDNVADMIVSLASARSGILQPA